MEKLTLKDVDFKAKTVLMRVDFNVPQDDNLNITDDTRIKAALASIKYVLENGANRLILLSHLGRPKGKTVKGLRLNSVAKRLARLLGQDVLKLDDCIGEEVKKQVLTSKNRVILLENLRFHPEEEKNDSEFARKLASLGDIFVNDAFGTAHRAHASTYGISQFLTSVAGFLLEKEIKFLGKALLNPKKPFMLILGGAKVSDKIKLIENLLPKVDEIIIGGGMAYTFLKALGKSVGNSKLEEDKIETAKSILQNAEKQNLKIRLPLDNIVTDKIEPNAKTKLVGEDIPNGFMGVDIGPKTINTFKESLKNVKTLIWNGPLGIFEIEDFSVGTKETAKFIASLSGITSIIGGGDTASAIKLFGLTDKMTHVSTGGGASLEFLEGKTLPGISALTDKTS